MLKRIIAVAALAGATACATVGGTPPAERLAQSQAAVRAAEELGASQEPRAAYHLKLAKEQLAEARQLMQSGRNVDADLVLQRAIADAEVAMALTKQVVAQREAARVKKELATLQGRTR